MTDLINKKEIERLIKKYESLSSKELKRINEATTCNNFILPLFEALGWDVRNKISDDLNLEKKIAGKRVDLVFYFDGVAKFTVECKKFDVDLREEKWAEQAVMYAWHKSVPWAILTDFESIKVFNAEWDEPNTQQSLVFEIPYKDYLTDKRILWLSKESIKKGELNKYAEGNFKRPKRDAVDKQLAADLISWRNTLFNNFKMWDSGGKLEDKYLEEAVQKILNRFVFIRTTEDRELEDQQLREIIRAWNEKEFELGFISKKLKELFKYYWDYYDSKLFKPHLCDEILNNANWEDSFFALVINELYKNKKGLHYNFEEIGADVLGAVYEQYLGQIQEHARKKQEEKESTKRKSQGIYYTPRFIVDYIVKKTLRETLKDSPEKITKIKILDPACGSGSFLIKAFEVLEDFSKNKINSGQNNNDYKRKLSILTSNIYGIDLDKEAVEIAELNLLLKALKKRTLLPNLSHNIGYGNSLISGEEDELKKYFKNGWRSKQPFNWNEIFSEVFKSGGFDVVIGNPPYIDSEEMSKRDGDARLYYGDKYESARGNWDIFCIFIEKGLALLKEGGYLGVIIPNKLLSADYAESIRNIIKKYSIISINDYSGIKVFSASVYPIVIIIKKSAPELNHQFEANIFDEVDGDAQLTSTQKIKQTTLNQYGKSWSPIFAQTGSGNFLANIIKKSKPLNDFCNVHEAFTVSEAYELKKFLESLTTEKDYFKFINTGTIDRYISFWNKKKATYIKSSYSRPIVLKDELKEKMPKRHESATKRKIIIAGMTKKIECFLDEKGEYLAGKSTTIVESSDINLLRFILAILNSKLLTFVYKNIFKSLSLAGGYIRIGARQIRELPIIFDKEKVLEIGKEAQKIIDFKERLQKLNQFIDDREYEETVREIDKTEEKIDAEVYKLYGLTLEEIRIVNDYNGKE